MAYIQISEQKIKQTIEMFKDAYGPENPVQLQKALADGDLYRTAGLTPVYILDDVTSSIIITSEENMNNKLH